MLYGVALWGLATGVIWALGMSALQGWQRLPFYLPFALIGFPVGGYFFGARIWTKTEQEYQKSVSNRTSA
jgi:hypothetical protein